MTDTLPLPKHKYSGRARPTAAFGNHQNYKKMDQTKNIKNSVRVLFNETTGFEAVRHGGLEENNGIWKPCQPFRWSAKVRDLRSNLRCRRKSVVAHVPSETRFIH